MLFIFQETLRKLFPRWEVILKHKDVLSFVYGLSDHPDDVIDLICDRGATYFTEHALKEFQQKCWNPDPADLGKIEANTHRQTHVIIYHIDELIRKVKAEKMETDILKEESFNIRNGYLSEYDPNCSDFILSRMYVMREVISSSIAFIFPDPATYYDHGAKNDPIPYVIGIPHTNAFFRVRCGLLRPLTKILRTLGHHQKIVISRVYSPDMCLKEKDFNLEGHLILDVSCEQSDIFSFIKEIELLTFQRIFFTGFKMFLRYEVHEKCCEQVRRLVHFSSNMMALTIHGVRSKLSASLIEHMAQELYGKAEPKSSSLQILSFIFESESAQDIKTLVRLKHLPQLKVLHLGGFEGDCFGVLLGSGSPSLEELSLKNVALSKQDINAFLNVLTQGGFPKLNCLFLHNSFSEYAKVSFSDIKPLSKYGLEINQIGTLAKLEDWNKVREAYLALEKDILSKTKLNESDTRSLCRAMLPTFSELDLSNNSLSGCLGDILNSHIFLNLRVLDLSNATLCSINDVRTVSTAAWEGTLRRLETLNLSKNTLTGSLELLLAKGFKFLHTLLLEDTKLSITDVQALSTAAQEDKLPKLRTLNLSKNILTDSLHDLLKGNFSLLSTLLLEDTKLSVDDVQVLSAAARGDKLKWLQTLNLSRNILTDTLYDLLQGEVIWLNTLLLEDTKLSVDDVKVLSAAVQESKLLWLRTLNLSRNILTDTLHILFKCPIYLEELLLEDTQLSVSDVQALSVSSWLSKLIKLNLSKNILTESLVLILDNEIPHLDTLQLEDTVLSTRDILALSSAVRKGKLPVLKYLNISQQNVGDLELAVINLIRRCAIDIDRDMQVKISLGSFRRVFQNDVQSICAESKVDVF